MAGKGGYQAPRNPAPVSGPGKLSRRTDGGPAQKLMIPTGMPYGDAGAMNAQEHAAPLSQSPSVAASPVVPPSGPAPTGMADPTLRPGEPVTSGSPLGPGAGPEALAGPYGNAAESYGPLSTLLSGIVGSDATGALANLLMEAQRRGV